jgi:hypothetical protein
LVVAMAMRRTILKGRTLERRGGRISKTLTVIILILISCNALAIWAAEPHYAPFGPESAVALMRKTVEAKMTPYVIESKGFTLTITKLLDFKMDWEQARFFLKCSFEVRYNKTDLLKESGQFTMEGAGLIAPEEQKLGVKILAIPSLKMKGLLGQFSEGIKIVAEKSLAGKEFWNATAPAVSTKLTKENFPLLVQVALAQQLPWTGVTGKTTVTLLVLHNLTLLPEPGKVCASFDLEGTRKGWIFKKFAGRAVVEVDVKINPDALAGVIRISRITDLKLAHTPGLMQGVIRGLVNAKLRGKEISFSWE